MNIQELEALRTNPRKMREEYLAKSGWLDFIQSRTEDPIFSKYSIRDKIDFILQGENKQYCYCGNLLKPNRTYCCAACVARSPENKSKISIIQKNNASERYQKTIQTNLERYGVTHNQLRPEVQAKTKAKKAEYYSKIRNESFIDKGVSIDKAYDIEWVKTALADCKSYTELCERYFGSISKTLLLRHIRDTLGIDHYYPKTSSWAERQLAQYIRDMGIEVISNDRKFLDGEASKLEIDILCPNEKIAIEYDGVFTHNGYEPNQKSQKKRYSCDMQGYQFIRIYEYEWEDNKELVKSVVAAKFGRFQKRVYARECQIRIVDSKEAKIFLDSNHLQGSINGTHIGLYDGEDLLSVFSIGKTRFKNKHNTDYELLRFATKQHTQVVGGFSKLLKYAKNMFGNKTILSYCDLRWSDGKTYEKYGTFVGKTSPGYCWINKHNGERLSRYQTQKSKLSKLLGETFDPSKTEQENMELAKYVQIWDDGNGIYIL